MNKQEEKISIHRHMFGSRLPTVHGHIYIMKCKSNGKKYVGQAVSHRYRGARNAFYPFGYEKRIQEHYKQAETSIEGCFKLNASIRKYGRENFTGKLLVKCPIQFLDHFEKMYIALYDTYHNGLNLNPGGFGGAHTAETLKRTSDTSIKRTDKERIDKLNENYSNIMEVRIDDIYSSGSLLIRSKMTTFDDFVYTFTYQTGWQPYEEAFTRAYNFAMQYVLPCDIFISSRCLETLGDASCEYEYNNDEIEKIKKRNNIISTKGLRDIKRKFDKYAHLDVVRMDIRLRKRRNVTKITVCIKDKERPRLTECEFGGTGINIIDAYNASIKFADMFKVKYEIYQEVTNLVNQL